MLKEEIKKYLKRNVGGLYITDRQLGKSEALLELLHEATQVCYIVTFSLAAAAQLRVKYFNKFNDGKEDNILVYTGATQDQIKKSFIDEYFYLEPLPTKFIGAVSSPVFPIKVNFQREEDKLNYKIIYNYKDA